MSWFFQETCISSREVDLRCSIFTTGKSVQNLKILSQFWHHFLLKKSVFLLSIFFRFVLAVRSPAFKAMFSQMEQVFQEVSVDASTEALKAMVKYMYTDCLDDADITEDLMKLAEKYELMQLKELCLPLFVKKIRVDNCLKVIKNPWNLFISIFFVKKWFKMMKILYQPFAVSTGKSVFYDGYGCLTLYFS